MKHTSSGIMVSFQMKPFIRERRYFSTFSEALYFVRLVKPVRWKIMRADTFTVLAMTREYR